jgi:hypothetical protein
MSDKHISLDTGWTLDTRSPEGDRAARERRSAAPHLVGRPTRNAPTDGIPSPYGRI